MDLLLLLVARVTWADLVLRVQQLVDQVEHDLLQEEHTSQLWNKFF